MAPAAADALRKLAGHWPDRELAVALNRMRCKSGDGETWTTVRVREMRERLGIAEFDPAKSDGQMVSLTRARTNGSASASGPQRASCSRASCPRPRSYPVRRGWSRPMR
jgi:hypothetical protein